MSLLNAIQFIPVAQKGNAIQSCQTTDDATMTTQFALLKAGKAGTSGAINGVICRWGKYGVVLNQTVAGVVQQTDAGGNFILGSTIDSFGNPGGVKAALVSGYNLGAPVDETVAAIHAAITMPAAASATGIHAAYTLDGSSHVVATDITDPAGKVPTIVGNDTDMLGPVTLTYTDLAGTTGKTLTLMLNGTTTVSPTLDQIPYGVDTVQSITYPPQTADASETVSVGTKGLVTLLTTNPDVPRCLSATGNASGIAGNQIILGTDKEGTQMLDTIALSGASTVAGVKAFKTVISTLTPVKVNASGDTVSIDNTDAIGLPYRMDHTGAFLAATFGGVREATFPTVTADGTDISKNTVTLSSDPDGAKSIVVDFIRCDAPLEFDRF